MLQMRLASGAPDEPDTGDWDAICATPGPRTLFATLFYEIAGGLPMFSQSVRIKGEHAQSGIPQFL